jgi:hypothetical protein
MLDRLAAQFRKGHLEIVAMHKEAAETVVNEILRDYHLFMAVMWQKLADSPPQ